MRIAILVLAVLLSGCITMPRYEWYADPHQGPMDYYRWQVVERDEMPFRCGMLPPEHGACVVRLNQGILKPTDKPLRDGLPVPSGEGKLCVIQATMPEADSHHIPAQDWEMSLFEHEVTGVMRDGKRIGGHCHSILHNWIPGRVN